MADQEIEKDPRENEPLNKYSNKLLEFQKKVSAISKDSVNPFFKSKYFDVNTVIDTIKPILNEVGLVVTQALSVLEGKNILETLVKDGQSIIADSQVLVPEIADIQKFGAALTYLRRYALVSLLLLQGEEDDDGNGAVKQKSAISKTETPKPTSPPVPDFMQVPDAYKTWSDKVKNCKTLDELNGYAENLKYATKTMKAGEVALLRSEFKQRRIELEEITI